MATCSTSWCATATSSSIRSMGGATWILPSELMYSLKITIGEFELFRYVWQFESTGDFLNCLLSHRDEEPQSPLGDFTTSNQTGVTDTSYLSMSPTGALSILEIDWIRCNFIWKCAVGGSGASDLVLDANGQPMMAWSATSSSSQALPWRLNYRGDEGDKSLCTRDLLCWSFQIARGMHYLASRKVPLSFQCISSVKLNKENANTLFVFCVCLCGRYCMEI